MAQVAKMVAVSLTDKPVLISVQKWNWARKLLPRPSIRPASYSKPFVTINRAALPEQLVEANSLGSEVLHRATSETRSFESCDGGTLFIDELGEMPLVFTAEAVAGLGRRLNAAYRISPDARST